jgi:hypothetical protein
MMRSIYRIGAMVSLGILILAGCGTSEKIKNRQPVFPVSGQFTVDGAPAAGAMISFHPIAAASAGRAIPSQARADAEGKFQLTTYATADGAPQGEFIVTVYWPAPRSPAASHEYESSELPPDRLRGRFASPSSSGLRARVLDEPTDFPPVDLASPEVRKTREYYLPSP